MHRRINPDLIALSFIVNDLMSYEEIFETVYEEQANSTMPSPERIPYNRAWHESMDKLIAALNDPSFSKDAAKKIVNEYMPSCPQNLLEEKVLSVICPYLNKAIFEIVDDIERQLEDPEVIRHLEETTFDDQFIEIRNLLARWHEILNQAVKLEDSPLSPSVIKSLLEFLPCTLIKICSHCKNKRKQYLHSVMPMVLQDVYRDASAIIKRFCTLSNAVLYFDLKDDSEVLKNVVANLGRMAPLIAYTIKYMIHTWETFQKLVCNKVLELWKKDEFVDLVRSHFTIIGRAAVDLFKSVKAPPVEEYHNRLKRVDALLAILNDLHVLYCHKDSSRPPDAQLVHNMVDFIILFKAYHELCESSQPGTYTDSCEDEDRLHDWAGVVNYHYRNSKHYLKEFTKRAEELKTSTDLNYKLGFHYCILDMTPLPEELNFEVAITNMNYIQEDIIESRILIPNWGTSVQGAVDASIYEYTLANLCEYFDDDNSFIKYEPILLKHLLGETFWSSLLCYDILNYCYKRSNKDLLFRHIQMFMAAYDALQGRQDNSLAVTMISRLIIDIYRLLTPKRKQELLENCKSPASLLLILRSQSWYGSREKLLASYKKLIPTESPSNLPKIIADLRRQPSVKNWIRLTTLLTLMGIEKSQDNVERTEDLLKVCTFVLNALEHVEDFKSRIMYDLMLILFDCARVENRTDKTCSFNWPLFSTLAESVVQKVQLPDEILVKLCHYLRNNAGCLAEAYSDSETAVIANLFCYLLENDSKEVHQEALETFDHIVEVANEDVVKGISCAITRRPKLREIVPAYLSKKQIHKITNIGSGNWSFVKAFAKHSLEFSTQHKCYKIEERWRDEKMPRLSEESLDDKAIRLSIELRGLAQVKKSLSVAAVGQLSNACLFFIEQR